MLYLGNYQWLLVQFLLVQFCIHYARAPWPSSDSSSIKLLGLFPDAPNALASEITTLSLHSRNMFQAAIILSQRLNLTIKNQLIGWQALQTGGNMVDAFSNTCRTITTSNIVGIVGPGFSREAKGIAPFSQTIGIPTISYSATDPDLSDKRTYPSFYRTVSSDKAAARAIANLFFRYNWTSAIIIYQNDAYGYGGADAITKIFNQNNLFVADTLIFDIVTLTFYDDFKTILTNSAGRIVIVWAFEVHTVKILQSALDNKLLGPQFLWILGFNVPLNLFNQSFHSELIGILTVLPVVGNVAGETINTTLLNAAYDIWQQYENETFPGPTKVDSYGMFAFDATWSLILALSKLCSPAVNDTSFCLSITNSSFCFDSRFLNADSFLHIIDKIEFIGVSGAVKFSNTTTDRTSGIYYVTQNIQPSSNGIDYGSVLKYSDSMGWESVTKTSVIVWPGNSLVPFSGFVGLSGVTLRIGVFVAPPFTMVQNIVDESGNNITKVIGYMPDLIDLLQGRLGFIAKIMIAPPNQTYNGMVRAVADKVYDIVVADVTVLAKRREIVDFSNTIYDNSIRIITRQTTSEKLSLFSYMKPFSGLLWIVLFITLLYSAGLILLLERQENEALREKSLISSVSMSIWFAFGTMTGYGADFHVQTAAGRLLSMGLYILSIILVATYTANLASNITLSRSDNIISGIDDIKRGKIPYSRIGILVGSSHEAYYIKEVSSGSHNFYPLQSIDEIYRFLLDNTIDVGIMDSGNLEYAVNTLYCNLTLVGPDFEPSSYGIVMPKGWLYSQAFDIAVLSIRESGALNYLKRKWFSAKTCSDSSTTDTSNSIKIEAVAGLFLTFLVISILALILFVWLKRLTIIKCLKLLILSSNSQSQKTKADENQPDLNNYELSTL